MATLAAESPSSSDVGTRHNLPPLIETFPSDKHPVREIGGGFTAQSVRGAEADACAATAAEMMIEARTMAVSNVSSDNGSMGALTEGECFPVPELPRTEDAMQVCPSLPWYTRTRRVFWSGSEERSAFWLRFAGGSVCHPAKVLFHIHTIGHGTGDEDDARRREQKSEQSTHTQLRLLLTGGDGGGC